MTALATPAGTRRYAERFAGLTSTGHFRSWPSTAPVDSALRLSSLGLGTYTGPDTDEADGQYQEAAKEAVRRGINLFDCAINYRNMRSERALGRGLGELFESGEAQRDEILIMSKGGYLPFDGAVPPRVAEYMQKTFLDSGLCREEIAGGVHCIAPRYLEDQLGRSLRNLGCDGIDVYFLHNIEQQLESVSAEELSRRLREAFVFLESAAAAGKIGCYGAATWNGFRVPPQSKGHLSLASLVDLARAVGGDGHHFRAVQLPYNLGMPEALTHPTQMLEGKPVPLLEAAVAFDLLVVTSVPLLQTQVLPHVPQAFTAAMPGLSTSAQRALQFVRSTPGVLAPLAGMRHREHVVENSALLSVPALGAGEFFRLIGG